MPTCKESSRSPRKNEDVPAAAATSASNHGVRARDAFEVMMSSNMNRKRIKRTAEPDPEPVDLPAAPTPPRNAFEKMMFSAQKPGAFCPESECASDQEVLGYLERHPEWRFMLAALIRDEKEGHGWLGDDDDYEENRSYIYTCAPRLPAVGDNNHNQIWQVGQLRKEMSENLLATETLKNHRLPPPPEARNEGSVLRAMHVHFEKQHMFSPRFYELCGLTFVYNDHVEIPLGYTDTRSECSATVKLVLESGEHICKIGVYLGNLLKDNIIGFLSTKNRWLIAKDGKGIEGKSWEGDSIDAPEGEAFQYFNIDLSRGSLKEVYECLSVPLEDLTGRSEVKSGFTVTPCIIPSLSNLCETKLQTHLKASASNASSSAYEEFRDYFCTDEDDRIDRICRFQDRLYESPEAKVLFSLILLRSLAVRRLGIKCNKLIDRAKREHQSAIEATERIKDKYKMSCQKEQAEIYAQHLAFCETKARLLAQDDSGNEIGSKERLCIFPNCRSRYQPKNLPYSKRCTAKDCGTAFEMCGCMSKVCPKCFKSFCPWHFQAHQNKICRPRHR